MDLDGALQTFIAEGRELLQDMERGLLALERDPEDPETLNGVFRAAHTVKGSAGLFGLDDLVRFAHAMETVLDQLRAGDRALTSDLTARLLDCGDHLGALLDQVADGTRTIDAELLSRGNTLMEGLGADTAGGDREVVCTDTAPAANERQPVEGGVECDHWHLSLRFGPDVLQDGMDPLSILRYLGTIGEIGRLELIPDAIPDLDALDPETCYLGCELTLKTDADKQTIEDAFQFIRDSSHIHILPPRSRVSDYIDLIRNLPEEDLLLGESLVRVGTLTEQELAQALAGQAGGGADEHRPLGEILVEERTVHPPTLEAALAKQRRVREHKARETHLVRVDAEKLDHLIALVGELVIAGASASLLAQQRGDVPMQEAAFTMTRFVEEIRDSALELRMVPIGETFNRFQRIVRDAGRELGKEIRLSISGSETELDKGMVEKIADPLMHLVRNAMDHGIEPVEIRRERGKPGVGTVRMDARHESGVVVIEVGDDGGGLDRDRILEKAIARGVWASDAGLTDNEIYDLIFEPGFSTSDEVTNLSGRGVGMDVVRRNVEALRGTVEVESHPGEGTTVRIRLPLTLAIIDGFLVGVGGADYVLPLKSVVECIEVTDGLRIGGGGEDYIDFRGEVLPLLRLRDLFMSEAGRSRRENIVVVQYGSKKVGLFVDSLKGELQTVIKPLGPIFRRLKGVSGSTILGSGDVALILDVQAMVEAAVRSGLGSGARAGQVSERVH
jgi:two-component system chemotaxis sensor kinase CheA